MRTFRLRSCWACPASDAAGAFIATQTSPEDMMSPGFVHLTGYMS